MNLDKPYLQMDDDTLCDTFGFDTLLRLAAISDWKAQVKRRQQRLVELTALVDIEVARTKKK